MCVCVELLHLFIEDFNYLFETELNWTETLAKAIWNAALPSTLCPMSYLNDHMITSQRVCSYSYAIGVLKTVWGVRLSSHTSSAHTFTSSAEDFINYCLHYYTKQL